MFINIIVGVTFFILGFWFGFNYKDYLKKQEKQNRRKNFMKKMKDLEIK